MADGSADGIADGTGGAAPDLVWSTGCVCAATVYRVWTEGRSGRRRREGEAEGPAEPTLHALCCLLIREDDEGAAETGGVEATSAPRGGKRRRKAAAAVAAREPAYSVQYAHVLVPTDRAAALWELDAGRAGPAALAAAANEAARPGQWPLAALDNVAAWKALHCVTTAALRASLGYGAFYRPARLGVDPASGLLRRAEPIPGRAPMEPRPGILRVGGSVPLDRTATAAAAVAGPQPSTAAYARMAALRQTPRGGADWTLEVEILTRGGGRFYREYSHSFRAPRKRAGEDAGELFEADERALALPGAAFPVRVRTLVPRSFDCLVTTSEDYSPTALIGVYARWYDALYGAAGAAPPSAAGAAGVTPPAFAYLGPEMSRRGEERDYAHVVGFPCWPLLKAAAATPEAVRAALSAYADTDGMWPLAGPRAFHLLAPWSPGPPPPVPDPAATAVRLPLLTPERRELAERHWPAGRVTSLFSRPTYLGGAGAQLAKFDFSAFFPTLYLALVPSHERLREAVVARLAARAKPWLKAPLVEFFGMLRRLQPAAYEAVLLLANYVSFAAEDAAAERGFALCAYVKDGFWGAFADTLLPDGASVPPVGPEERARRAEALRAACEAAADDALGALGLTLPEGVGLSLRLEGLYTDAFAWNPNCYWLGDRLGGRRELSGFPGKPAGFAAEAKAELSRLLAELAELEDGGDLVVSVGREGTTARRDLSRPRAMASAMARDACESLVRSAFERRADHDFWSAPADAYDDAARIAVVADDRAADADCGRRLALAAVGVCGERVAVPRSLFRGPLMVPAVACLELAAPAVAAFCRLFNGALAAKLRVARRRRRRRLEADAGTAAAVCECGGGAVYEEDEDDDYDDECEDDEDDEEGEEFAFSLERYAFMFVHN